MAWLNLPNFLTLTRIVGSCFFLYFLMHENWSWSLLLFFLAAFTDMVDGTLARILEQRTRLGGFLDPMADKFLMFCGFFVLTWKGIIPVWATGIVVARDLMISVAIFYFISQKIAFAYRPTYLSKVTTFFQMGTLFCFLIDLYRHAPLTANSFALGRGRLFYLTVVTVLLTLVTGVQYVRIGLRILHGSKN